MEFYVAAKLVQSLLEKLAWTIELSEYDRERLRSSLMNAFIDVFGNWTEDDERQE